MNAVFDRSLLRLRRDRAAADILQYDFLFREVAERLLDRLTIVRKDFPVILDLGGGHGVLSEKLRQRSGTEYVVTSDLSPAMVKQSSGPALVADEEYLPFANGSLDAVISNLALHWTNDLPGALTQVFRALKPDGLFLAAVMGGQSLKELRDSLMTAELKVTGGVSPRVSPLIDLRDMGALLQRAGFALPVVDGEIITADYSHPLKLMHDLRGMAASNAVLQRLRIPTRRAVIMEAARLYQEKYGDKAGRVPATFEIIYAIGWVPHASQQQPLQPGSAKLRLATALGAKEIKA